LLARKQKR